MFCPKCGAEAVSAGRFCASCGSRLSKTAEDSSAAEIVVEPENIEITPPPSKPISSGDTEGKYGQFEGRFSRTSHPWRRYFSRVVDLCLVALPMGIAVMAVAYLTAPDLAAGLDRAMGNQIFAGVFVLILWAVAESVLLSTVGTTPAKAIFGIRLRSREGGRLSLKDSFLRTAIWSAAGMGLGIPLAALVTQILSYRRLNKTGSTVWDSAVGSTVTHATWGPMRTIVASVASITALVIIVALNVAGK